MSLMKLLEAVGGTDALESLNLFQTESTGSVFVVFEAELPDEIAPASTYEQRITTIQVDEEFYRVDSLWQSQFENFAFLPQTNMGRLVNGAVGYGFGNTAAIFNGTLTTAVVSSLKRHETLFHPHILLKAALAQPDLILADNNDTVVVADSVSDLVLTVDSDTGLPTKLIFSECNPLTRDTELVIMYSNWTIESGGVLFPAKVELLDEEGSLLWIDLRTNVTVDPTLDEGIFDLPPQTDLDSFDPTGDLFGITSHYIQEAFYEIGFVFPFGVGYSPIAEIAPGVSVLASGANSMAIETEEGVIVLEAAGSEYNARLLVDAVEGIAPGRPITHLIQSHHHVDHASGVREFVSLTGASLVVHDADFFGSVFAAESMIRPLAPTPDDLDIVKVEALGNLTLVEDANVTVTVYHTTLDPHALDNIFVLIDRNGARILYEADWYNARFGGTVVTGGPEALFQALRNTGILTADCSSEIPLTIVPAHGFATSLEDSIAELEGFGVDLGCSSVEPPMTPAPMTPAPMTPAPSSAPSAAAKAASLQTSPVTLLSLLVLWMLRR